MTMKESTVYSLATIFFSQLSNLGTTIISQDYQNYPLAVLPFLMLAAICGGYIGTLLNQTLQDRTIEKLYLSLIVVLIMISLVNVWQNSMIYSWC